MAPGAKESKTVYQTVRYQGKVFGMTLCIWGCCKVNILNNAKSLQTNKAIDKNENPLWFR